MCVCVCVCVCVVTLTLRRETLIVVKGRHPQHLLDLRHKAERVGLCVFLVKDAGKTEVC